MSPADQKPNNPRFFADTVTVEAWRTDYDKDRALADLFIDVVFDEGRIGDGKNYDDWPVRFRLSLRRAEVHVIRDATNVIRFPPGSVRRAEPRTNKTKEKRETKSEVAASGSVEVSKGGLSIAGKGKADGSVSVQKSIEDSRDKAAISFMHRPAEYGYVFTLQPTDRDRLDGTPWSTDSAVMKLKDTKSPRKRGEPPEIVVEIQCLREDLIIEDIQFKDPKLLSWDNLPRNKQIIVEQYLREELMRMGFACDDLSEPFARLVLADTVSVEG